MLLLDSAAFDEIDRVVKYAMANPLSVDDMHRLMAGELAPIGNNPAHVCRIQKGFTCAFSIEPTRDDKKRVRHLSISAGDMTQLPGREAAQMLAEAFGFVGMIDDDETVRWAETDGTIALNIVQEL